jgi:DNA-binding NtrC family response regulator
LRRTVLIVDDEELIRRSLELALAQAGYSVVLAASGREALDCLALEAPDCLVLDLRLGDLPGLEVLREARERFPELKAIVITAHGDVDSAVAALRLGAYDFIKKPFDLEEVIASLNNAVRTDALEHQVAYHQEGRRREPEMVYASETMRAAVDLLEKAACQPVPVVLIRGETGTGKQLAARFFHRASPRSSAPFIELNCSAIPENLVESELFGHERGAFSDARDQKRGLVELADGGTLFLDEVGDLPAAAQAKFLKFVEDFEFRRLGGTKTLSVDCRVIAATHRALETEPLFRRDLYYRLAGITVELPPLRDRGDDVLLLAGHFLNDFARRYRKRLEGFTPEAIDLLRGHRWLGNVRELRAAISNAALIAEGSTIGIAELAGVERAALAAVAELPTTLDPVCTIEELNLAYVTRVVELCGGNKALAAQKLGISRQTLARWLAEPGAA